MKSFTESELVLLNTAELTEIVKKISNASLKLKLSDYIKSQNVYVPISVFKLTNEDYKFKT